MSLEGPLVACISLSIIRLGSEEEGTLTNMNFLEFDSDSDLFHTSLSEFLTHQNFQNIYPECFGGDSN